MDNLHILQQDPRNFQHRTLSDFNGSASQWREWFSQHIHTTLTQIIVPLHSTSDVNKERVQRWYNQISNSFDDAVSILQQHPEEVRKIVQDIKKTSFALIKKLPLYKNTVVDQREVNEIERFVIQNQPEPVDKNLLDTSNIINRNDNLDTMVHKLIEAALQNFNEFELDLNKVLEKAEDLKINVKDNSDRIKFKAEQYAKQKSSPGVQFIKDSLRASCRYSCVENFMADLKRLVDRKSGLIVKYENKLQEELRNVTICYIFNGLICEVQLSYSATPFEKNSHMNHVLYEINRCENLNEFKIAFKGLATKNIKDVVVYDTRPNGCCKICSCEEYSNKIYNEVQKSVGTGLRIFTGVMSLGTSELAYGIAATASGQCICKHLSTDHYF